MPRPRLAPAYLVTFYLPVTYNADDSLRPGGSVEEEKFTAVEDELAARFGAYTKQTRQAGAPLEGQWVHRGLWHTDYLVPYSVVAPRTRETREWFTAYCDYLCREFRQLEIFLMVNAISVARYPLQP